MLLLLSETEQFNVLSDGYWTEAKSGNDSLQNVKEYGQKLFVTLSRFRPLRGLCVSLDESVKKGKFLTKIFFQTMLN